MVVGQKNTGKSSFMRFLVNRGFSQNSERPIYLLEADCGQPIFGLAGQVCLYKMTNCDRETPKSECIKSFFINWSSPAEYPDLYLKCLNALIAEY
jgi:polynucleotide 5'-kinase involved in rRNA processing